MHIKEALEFVDLDIIIYHDFVVFMVKAIFIRDLTVQEKQCCPDGTPVPYYH